MGSGKTALRKVQCSPYAHRKAGPEAPADAGGLLCLDWAGPMSSEHGARLLLGVLG